MISCYKMKTNAISLKSKIIVHQVLFKAKSVKFSILNNNNNINRMFFIFKSFH